MDRKIGIGIIGMGWMGQVHARSYRRIPDQYYGQGITPRLVICADDVEERAKEGQERFGFEHATNDWRQVVDHADVEIVNITTPNFLHLELVKAATEAGKHVFCEKPVGRWPKETAEVEQAARKAGVLTCVGYNYRYPPVVQYVRQLIQEGRLGKITHYRGRFLIGYGSNPNGVLSWRFQKEFSGAGTLGDLMSHVIDQAHYLAGPIKQTVGNQETFIRQRPLSTPGEGTHFSVSTGGPKADVTNEDYVSALARFECGAQGTLEACRVIFDPKCELAFELNGTKGSAAWNVERLNELQLYLPEDDPTHDGPALIFAGPDHPSFADFYPGPAINMSYEDLKLIEANRFLRSVAEGKQEEPGFAEALAVSSVQAAIRKSWDTGSWQDVVSLRRD
jgi:predicted dehydrogenase